MNIQVSHYAASKEQRFENRSFEIKEGATVRDILSVLHLGVEDIGIVVVNGESGTYGRRLQEGDRITLIPPLAGG